MKVLILAGGRGTRIKQLFPKTPKPLLEIMGKPILELLLIQLSKFEIHVNINRELKSIVKKYDVTLEIEDKRQGNATPIKSFIGKYDLKENFLVVYCDSWNNIDYQKLEEVHKKNDTLMTMTVKDISRIKSFGIVTLNNRNKVSGFTRKRLTNIGVFICNPLIKDFICSNTYQDLDKDIFPKLINKKQLGIYIHSGLWHDTGTNRFWNNRRGRKR